MPMGLPPPDSMGTPPMGGPKPGGMAGAASLLNPMDATMMAQKGQIQPGMKVIDLLNMIGVSPDDPVEKLMQATQAQKANATMPGKMRTMAGRPPPTGPPGLKPQGAPSALEGGGLEGLMNRMR